MTRRTLPFALTLLGASLVASVPVHSQSAPAPQPTLVRNVALGRTDDAPRGALLLRNGRIESVLDGDTEPPPGVRIVDGEGLYCLPAFVDAYTRTGCATPEPVKDQDVPVSTSSDIRVDMRLANRKGIQPAFRATEGLAIETKDSEAWREAGFGAALVAPGSQLLAGNSVLAATREAAMRDLVMRSDVYAHAAFQASGDGYPSTLMGFMAQLRQFFMDAARHSELERRHAHGRPGLRPPFDDELTAGSAILAGDRVLLCDAESHRDIERWIKLSDEFGFKIAVSGGKDAWRLAETLAKREIPVVLTLDWGKEVDDPLEKDKKKKKKKTSPRSRQALEDLAAEAAAEEAEAEKRAAAEEESQELEEEEATEEVEEEDTIDWEYEEPLGVRIEKRRLWEEGRDCAIRLHEASVRFAFGSDGDKPSKLMDRVRDLVEAGLPEEVALDALTQDAALLVGAQGRLGRVAPGYDATFALWSGDPLTDEKAKPVWVFVDGFPTEYEKPEEKEEDEEEGSNEGPAEGVDVTGTWTFEVEREDGTSTMTIVLEMTEDGSVTGELTTENPRDQSELTADVSGSVSGKTLELDYTLSIGNFEITASLEGTLDGDTVSGDATYEMPFSEDPIERSFEGTREPDSRR